MKHGLSLLVCVVASTHSLTAAASLLVNGDFETVDGSMGLVNGTDLDDLTSPFWDVYVSIPGWTTASGPGIEVQSNTIHVAHSPNRYVELDSHPLPGGPSVSHSSMIQSVFLQAGRYELTLWYRPRTNTAGDNGILVSVDAGLLAPILVDGVSSDFSDWKRRAFPFHVPIATQATVRFSATGTENRLGGLIDDVALLAVPEPSALAVWCLLAIVTHFSRQALASGSRRAANALNLAGTR